MFQNMIESIKEDLLYYLYRVSYSRTDERESKEKQEQEVYYNRSEADEAAKPPVRGEDTTNRNEPCPCGGGKKFKKCCGRTQLIASLTGAAEKLFEKCSYPS